MRQDVSVLTIIVVLLMVAAILTSIWYLMFAKADATPLAETAPVHEDSPAHVAPTTLVTSGALGHASTR